MKKLLAAAVILLVWASPVSAMYLVPGTGNKTTGVTESIEVRAAPITSTDGQATIRLHFNNVTVVSWTDNIVLTALGSCNTQGDEFTATDVCVTTNNVGVAPLVYGSLLGTIRVTWGGLGAATIVGVTGSDSVNNGYYNGTTHSDQLGNLGVYTVTTGAIPPTALELPINYELVFAVAGLVLIFMGAGLKIYLSDAKKQAQY